MALAQGDRAPGPPLNARVEPGSSPLRADPGAGCRRRFLRYNFGMASVSPELEIKYDVDDDFELPSLAGLVAAHDGVAPVVEGEAVTTRLEATYFDTPDHRLARAH